MKTRQSIEKQMFAISEEERANLQTVVEDIKQIVEKKQLTKRLLKSLQIL